MGAFPTCTIPSVSRSRMSSQSLLASAEGRIPGGGVAAIGRAWVNLPPGRRVTIPQRCRQAASASSRSGWQAPLEDIASVQVGRAGATEMSLRIRGQPSLYGRASAIGRAVASRRPCRGRCPGSGIPAALGNGSFLGIRTGHANCRISGPQAHSVPAGTASGQWFRRHGSGFRRRAAPGPAGMSVQMVSAPVAGQPVRRTQAVTREC